MKMFKGLFIDQGIIKAGEFPVEPDSCFLPFCETNGTDIEYCKCHELETEYERAMRDAKANAVECEDQEEAAKVLAESEISGELFIFPSGWDYVEKVIVRVVAKLYRTDEKPELEESQEVLWEEAEGIVAEAMGTYKTSLTVALASYARKELEKHFTITRRK